MCVLAKSLAPMMTSGTMVTAAATILHCHLLPNMTLAIKFTDADNNQRKCVYTHIKRMNIVAISAPRYVLYNSYICQMYPKLCFSDFNFHIDVSGETSDNEITHQKTFR